MQEAQNLESFDFAENPFAALLNGAGEGEASAPTAEPVAPPQGATPAQGALEQATAAAGQAGGQAGGQVQPAESQFDQGVSPGNTRPLLGAISNLENVIKDSSDRDTILTVR